ncbi:recombinase family protein [Halonatronum saccharophilum]|uniref:recombinase family protein n=1 Tax=Halonatronum saccharophilum TaxID=150060 RepID=UPI000488AF89|nr:recombinase family protein [Halonatronum saccharophilum]
MKKAALYIRVSTHHQIDKDSLKFQKEELENYSKYALGIDDYETFTDAGYSGKNTNRPGYQEMMQKIKAGEFTHLLVWKIDRISRNLVDFAKMYDELKEYSVAFISKNEQFDTSSAMGEAMLKIILVFAELERKLASERVSSIMIDRAQKGLWNGAPTPLGYDYNSDTQKLIINSDEAQRVKYIFNLYQQHKSLLKIQDILNKEGIKSKNDSKWHTKTLNQILRNPIYKGTYRYNYKESGRGDIKDEEEWVVVEDCFPAIISKDQFKDVNTILNENRNRMHTEVKYTHVFSSLLKCGDCGESYLAYLDRARSDGYRPSAYRCKANYFPKSSDEKCYNMIGEVNLGPFILDYIINLEKAKQTEITSEGQLQDILIDGKYFKEVVGLESNSLAMTYKILTQSSNKAFEDSANNQVQNKEIEILQKEKKKYERAFGRLEDLYLYSDDSMSKKDYLIKKKEIKDKIDEINEELFSLNKERQNPIFDLSFISEFPQYFLTKKVFEEGMNYKALVLQNKDLVKDFMRTILKKVVIDDKKVSEIEFINGLKHKFIWEEDAKGLKGRM